MKNYYLFSSAGGRHFKISKDPGTENIVITAELGAIPSQMFWFERNKLIQQLRETADYIEKHGKSNTSKF